MANVVNTNPGSTLSDGQEQYLRKCTLIVYGTGLNGQGQPNGVDLSALRIKFSVKRSDTSTPNMADIRVYNLSADLAQSMLTVLNPAPLTTGRGRVILQAGYEDNYGVIFQGNIYQVIVGRESATDTFVDIIAGDGSTAYNYAIVNTTIGAGSTQVDQVNAVVGAMTPKGVTAGHIGDLPNTQLPRGKVMFGNARNYARSVAQTTGKTWSIQNEKITFVPLKSYLPGTAVKITSATGMIGTPQQTYEGVNVKCLLNPKIRVGGLIQLDNKSIQRFKINLAVKPGSGANIPAPVTADGYYYVYITEYTGDTRGVDWYVTVLCLNQSPTSNPGNSVQVGSGPQ